MPALPNSRSRLSREARREQLLDVATELVVTKGAEAVTMERLAEWAGVSKALPYSHFENRDDVLIALYQRVVGELGRRIIEAMEGAAPGTDKVELVVTTYLDTVADLGPVLSAVTAPGSHSARLADGDRRAGPRFVARLLREHFGESEARARAAAPVVLAGLNGAVGAWSACAASRREAQQMSVAVLRALLDRP